MQGSLRLLEVQVLHKNSGTGMIHYQAYRVRDERTNHSYAQANGLSI